MGMRGAMLAAAGALALQGQHAMASDITLSLDMSVFPLEGDGASFIAALLDDQGNLVVIDNGTPNTMILGLTTLVPIPDTYEDVKLDVATMQWSSPSQLAYSLDVSLMNIDQHTNAGWIAEEIMTVPELSVPATGRLPATPEDFTVSLECVTPGKARIQFQFNICEEAAATWEDGCSEGASQVVTFVVDKECGDSNALPEVCMPDTPPAISLSGESASVSIFNLNVAEGAGIDRTKLVEKGSAIAAVVALEGSDVACLQEVWDEGERAALTEGLAAAGLGHSVTVRGAGLLITSRFPIVRCNAATFPADSYGGTIESFSNKGVLGALLDIGGGALLYVFVTHMAAFSDLSGSQAQLETIKQEMDSQLSEAAAIYGPAERIGAVVMGDFNLNAATEEDYNALVAGLGGAGVARDLHVEEHGDWVTWRDNTETTGVMMTCTPGSAMTWGTYTQTCPDDGRMDRDVSLLDYIFAIDVMPVSNQVLAKLNASDNKVLSHHSPTYDWLQLGDDFTSTSLSDHQARSVTLRNPFIPSDKASSAVVAAPFLAATFILATLFRV